MISKNEYEQLVLLEALQEENYIMRYVTYEEYKLFHDIVNDSTKSMDIAFKLASKISKRINSKKVHPLCDSYIVLKILFDHDEKWS